MPRNAAQLRAAATATGWFNGPHLSYVGDGYTVPYQTGYLIGPAFGGLMLVYKDYLDRNYLEFSRLHDWLYTPYGPDLIGASQEEADLALREELQAVSPSDALIVYQACHTFGGPYFGRSVVGYVTPAGEGSGDNIGPGNRRRGFDMADFKVIMVFQQQTLAGRNSPLIGYNSVPRSGGWTESFWVSGGTVSSILAILKPPRTVDSYPSILGARAACLPLKANIVGVRLYEGGQGRGQFYAMGFPGAYQFADVPSMALLCQTINGASISVRRFTMRGVPDDQVSDGEFSPTAQFARDLADYFNSLNGTSFRGQTVQPVHDVFSITANGLVTLREPNPFGATGFVTFKNCVTEESLRRGGEYSITATGPGLNQFTVAGWLWGDCTGGTVYKPVYAMIPVTGGVTSAVRITNHKVGRPFAGFRGRKSRVRKKQA